MALEFEINGNIYRSEKLSAKEQFHLSRKISPIVPKLVPVLMRWAAAGGIDRNNMDQLVEVFGPFADALANMDDTHADFVIDTCMATVKRKTSEKSYASIYSGGVCMFDDIEFDTLIQIVVKVIWDNLGNFIRGLLSSAPSNEVQAKA